jgi:hypothetical protein
MALTPRQIDDLERVARELDLVVFRLETPASAAPANERERLRRDLEELRDRLTQLVQDIG